MNPEHEQDKEKQSGSLEGRGWEILAGGRENPFALGGDDPFDEEYQPSPFTDDDETIGDLCQQAFHPQDHERLNPVEVAGEYMAVKCMDRKNFPLSRPVVPKNGDPTEGSGLGLVGMDDIRFFLPKNPQEMEERFDVPEKIDFSFQCGDKDGF